MNYVSLPSFRTVLENMSLHTVKLEKILAEGQSRVASFLDLRYPDGQDIIFLLGGKPVKAGRFTASGREILTVSEALEKMRHHRDGVLNFYEISKMLMIVILGTFIFEPTHGRLKTKLINFQQLLALFGRKRFTGYLELKLKDGLNYLTFFQGQAREGYFSTDATPEQMEFPLKLVEQLVEQSGENDEINVYESVGEDGLHADSAQTAAAVSGGGEPPLDENACLEDEKAEFTSEILDLCLAAIYEDLFRLMAAACMQQIDAVQTEALFASALDPLTEKYPALFARVREREDGMPMAAGLINFERLLKAKKTRPATVRDQEFMLSMNELASLWLRTMRRTLTKPVFDQGLKSLSDKIASSRKAYQGNFTIIKFLYEFSRLLEKVYTE